MDDAARRLDAENLEGALEEQAEALDELQRAQEELRDELEEETEAQREELQRKLTGRLYGMLAEAQLVAEETKRLDASARDAEADESAEGAEARAADARSLARRERALATDADDIVRVLDEENSSVVAPQILERLQDDLENVASRLDENETGELTQLLQTDVESAIRELIEALEPREREGKDRDRDRERAEQLARARQEEEEQQGEGEGEQDRLQLITPVMEIRMLVSAQRRIRARTERLGSLGLLPEDDTAAAEDEPQPARLAREQALRIAEAQKGLGEVTDALIEKFPIIDEFLLGPSPFDDRVERDEAESEDGEDAVERGATEEESSPPDAPDEEGVER